jgi:hypothetical protein
MVTIFLQLRLQFLFGRILTGRTALACFELASLIFQHKKALRPVQNIDF